MANPKLSDLKLELAGVPQQLHGKPTEPDVTGTSQKTENKLGHASGVPQSHGTSAEPGGTGPSKGKKLGHAPGVPHRTANRP